MHKNEPTRFQIGDIIATDVEHPHLVLEIVQNQNEVGKRFGEYGYRLLDLNTGNHTVAHVGGIDSECILHDQLTANTPRAFDGALVLLNGRFVLRIKHNKTVSEPLQNIKVEVGAGGGGAA